MDGMSVHRAEERAGGVHARAHPKRAKDAQRVPASFSPVGDCLRDGVLHAATGRRQKRTGGENGAEGVGEEFSLGLPFFSSL